MEYATLCMAMVLLLGSPAQASGKPQADDMEAVPSSQVGNHSRYHEQVEFINHFLLNTAGNINISHTTMTIPPQIIKHAPDEDKDNNTTPNEIQVIPVPSVFSSVIDTLPVHPRIPRSPARRRSGGRQHRHSTRVFPAQPVRYLLPPFENKIFQEISSTTLPPFSAKPIVIPPLSSVTPTTTSTTETVLEAQQVEIKPEPKESTQSVAAPQYRKVFIPPPLRYLLPPFFYENYINAQLSTTQTSVTENKLTTSISSLNTDYYSSAKMPSNMAIFSQNNSTVEASSLAPIIVIETVSQPDEEIGTWNYQSESDIKYTTSASRDYSYIESDIDKELISKPSTTTYLDQFKFATTSSQNPQSSKVVTLNTAEYGEYKRKAAENNPSRVNSPSPTRYSHQQHFSSTSVPQNSASTILLYNGYKTAQFDNYPSRSTTSIPPSSSTTNYPILRGPNIEQVLFETGDFHSFDRAFNESDDTTVSMMNRPLLAQEVAQAGMKITANLKEDQIIKGKFSRGRMKYRHLNQFNFQNYDDALKPKGFPKSSQLSVAETSYYSGRTPKHLAQEAEIHVIPGRPGKDYPTLTKPPLRSSFSCRSVGYHRGYVADPSTGCQVFYICVGNGPGEAMLCPNGTVFSQDFLVCDWWYNVDCQTQT